MISIYAIVDREALGQTVQVFAARNDVDALRSFRALAVNQPLIPINQLDLVHLADLGFSSMNDTEYLRVKDELDSSFAVNKLPVLAEGSKIFDLARRGFILPNGTLKESFEEEDEDDDQA